jgi:hypothetical protein
MEKRLSSTVYERDMALTRGVSVQASAEIEGEGEGWVVQDGSRSIGSLEAEGSYLNKPLDVLFLLF